MKWRLLVIGLVIVMAGLLWYYLDNRPVVREINRQEPGLSKAYTHEYRGTYVSFDEVQRTLTLQGQDGREYRISVPQPCSPPSPFASAYPLARPSNKSEDKTMETCFICRKHNGQQAAPPGGYIYEDEHWMVCHAPGKLGPLGTLFIESKRHFLDYAEMTDEESASLGNVMRKIYHALKLHTGAERVYQVTLIDGTPHFHSWLVTHRKDDAEKGMKFLAQDDSCSDEDAAALAEKLREAME